MKKWLHKYEEYTKNYSLAESKFGVWIIEGWIKFRVRKRLPNGEVKQPLETKVSEHRSRVLLSSFFMTGILVTPDIRLSGYSDNLLLTIKLSEESSQEFGCFHR